MKSIKLIIAILTIVLFVGSAYGQDDTNAPETPVPITPAPEMQVPAAVSPKPDGVIRIGLVTAKTQLGQDVNAAEASEALRQLWADYLKGPTVEVVNIDARTPTNVNIEAEQKGCDFVLYSAVSKKTKTSLFGSLVKAATPILGGQPQPAANANQDGPGPVDNPQTASQPGKDFVGNLISKIGTSDVIILDFSLSVIKGSHPLLKDSVTIKADKDSQASVTTLLEQAAERVLQAAVKK